MTEDLLAWLREQLDTDEQRAQEALEDINPWLRSSTWHARVLRQVAAHRAILDRYEDALVRVHDPAHSQPEARTQIREYEDFVLPAIVGIYEGRSGYRNEWRPQ